MIDIPKGTFNVRIFREDFSFSAGHISIYQDDVESFHGHDYHVAVEIEGDLTEDFILIDFKQIKNILKPICKGLNHHVLVPTFNSKLKIFQNGKSTKVEFKDKHIELPTSDVKCLELPNICCEMLAYHIFIEIKNKLKSADNNTQINKILVEVSESAGQSASFEAELSNMGGN